MIRLRATVERWPLREAFTIARGGKREAVVVVVHAVRGEHEGRGEALPYARYGEDPESVLHTIERASIASRDDLASFPPGAARNAIDLALWDLEAKERDEPVWQLAGLPEPRPVVTAHTIPIRSLDETRAIARRERHRALLKIKVGAGDDDLARVEAVRDEAREARLIVDANEGWTFGTLERVVPRLAELGVELIEQPLRAEDDSVLEGFDSPIPLCADESFHGTPDALDAVARRYDAVNVKLDKQGGLTTALAAVARAKELGLDVMIGTMVATSLAVAPAVLLASSARWADLDAAIFLERDREHALRYQDSYVHPPARALWG